MTETDEIKKVLNETAIFAGISDAPLTAIAEVAESRSCEHDEMLYEHGDKAIDVYVLVSGTVRFAFGNRTGTLSSGTVMHSRMIFGWAALVPEHPKRLGSAQCIETSKIILLPGDPVRDILRKYPVDGFRVMERLCGMIARNFMEQHD